MFFGMLFYFLFLKQASEISRAKKMTTRCNQTPDERQEEKSKEKKRTCAIRAVRGNH